VQKMSYSERKYWEHERLFRLARLIELERFAEMERLDEVKRLIQLQNPDNPENLVELERLIKLQRSNNLGVENFDGASGSEESNFWLLRGKILFRQLEEISDNISVDSHWRAEMIVMEEALLAGISPSKYKDWLLEVETREKLYRSGLKSDGVGLNAYFTSFAIVFATGASFAMISLTLISNSILVAAICGSFGLFCAWSSLILMEPIERFFLGR
jgi:hypothetical protein